MDVMLTVFVCIVLFGAVMTVGCVFWAEQKLSLDCRDSRHEACEASGGCMSCACH